MNKKRLSDEEIQNLIIEDMDNILKFHENVEYFLKNQDKIKEEFAGKKIIIVDKKVKPLTQKILKEIRNKNKHYQAFIIYVPRKGQIMML